MTNTFNNQTEAQSFIYDKIAGFCKEIIPSREIRRLDTTLIDKDIAPILLISIISTKLYGIDSLSSYDNTGDNYRVQSQHTIQLEARGGKLDKDNPTADLNYLMMAFRNFDPLHQKLLYPYNIEVVFTNPVTSYGSVLDKTSTVLKARGTILVNITYLIKDTTTVPDVKTISPATLEVKN